MQTFNKEKLIKVKNRSSLQVVYSIPSKHIMQTLAPGQTIMVPYGELELLSYEPGGKTLMSEFLLITDPEAPEHKNPTVEPEYYYDDAQVIELLTKGSLDEFLDALDFAPMGVIELIKKHSLSLPLNDVAKREALKEKCKFDVEKMIENGDEAAIKPTAAKRRVGAETEDAVEPVKPKRRAKKVEPEA